MIRWLFVSDWSRIRASNMVKSDSVFQSLSQSCTAAALLHSLSPIAPHSFIRLQKQSIQTHKEQIFISYLFIFKSCLFKVTKEQTCLWQAQYNDSMTYCVRRKQLWSSSIIVWVKSCAHCCCLPQETMCTKTRLANKDYSVRNQQIHTNFKIWIKYKHGLWKDEFLLSDLFITVWRSVKISVWKSHRWVWDVSTRGS